MAKTAKRSRPQHARKPGRQTNKKPPSTSVNKAASSSTKTKKQPKPRTQQIDPVIPFSPEDSILLVGEGDLSFATSIIEHHDCENVTATVLEKDKAELLEKYPHAAENIAKIEAQGGRVVYGVDARKMGPYARKGKDPEGTMERIIFNFPHVGGKSTDVNRQVRHNQEMLVSFFRRALLSLAPGGTVTVTLFEGEPYTLWNIRDLGRHSGMQVERSFAFQPSAYPGYHHARTLGVVKNKKGVSGGGWRGEERAARSYVFARKGDDAKPVKVSKKRKRRDDDEEEDDEEDSDEDDGSAGEDDISGEKGDSSDASTEPSNP